jgi:glucan 1,3-beta-glucosidase
MRVTNILSAALVAAPLAVSAAGTLGFAVGNTKPDGSCKAQQDYERDLDALTGPSKVVRTYTSDGCDTAKNIIPAAKAKGFQVVLGVWLVDTICSFCTLRLTIAQA